MAEWTLDPEPTSEELKHAARLLLKARAERGNPRLRDMAAEIGLHETDLSRMLHAHISRHWGYRRLSRIAKWIGVSLDALLRRPEGTTQVMEAAGAKPRPVPTAVMGQRELFELASRLADEKLRLRAELDRLLKEDYPDEEERAQKVGEIVSIMEVNVERMMGLRDMLRERTRMRGRKTR